jgi:renal tumor antigen
MDQNLYEWIRGRRHHFPESKVKLYIYQLMKALEHMHRNGIFHRDIKPENVLLADEMLKLADFGSCRGIYSKQPFTEYISTRWYRAPECLLTDGYYSYKMDIWGVGCVFFEILTFIPLFPGENELDQIHKIHNILGTPPPDLLAKFQSQASHMTFNFPTVDGTGFERLISQASPEAKTLIRKMLAYNPDDRISARQVLNDPYFRDLREVDQPPKLAPSPGLTGKLLGTDGDNATSNEESMRMSEAEGITPLPPIKNRPRVSKKIFPGEAKFMHNSSNKSITVDVKPVIVKKPGKTYVSPYGRKYFKS